MKITCKYRSNVILDKYEERLMMCSRIKGHDAAVKEIFRMWNQANTTSIMEPKGLVENNHRPDLVLSSFQNNNQQILLDFTTITALSTKVINNAWKQSGYTANKAENSKNQSYANAYDANSYDLLPLVMDLEGCPGEGLAKFIKHVPKKLDNISIRQKMNPADTARNLLTNGNAKLFWHS
eukprot:CAMPEP_0204825204 /NCGR_PEP_ID=MMETSP1346-20131115/3134_1 /ASSEMBLY_ACC=CAM_ASM_000771 /TAXON_ID=215587 /ORGANISM="Aplanochytrium stocchinoi, Strain GSBS06" /LENGTH=179 /DNA_ID=CAMNT_0051952743 /DNA_START=142 /DNA_END=677 /DNA_ORIENTATION=-